jgi:hypothetical protein
MTVAYPARFRGKARTPTLEKFRFEGLLHDLDLCDSQGRPGKSD